MGARLLVLLSLVRGELLAAPALLVHARKPHLGSERFQGDVLGIGELVLAEGALGQLLATALAYAVSRGTLADRRCHVVGADGALEFPEQGAVHVFLHRGR